MDSEIAKSQREKTQRMPGESLDLARVTKLDLDKKGLDLRCKRKVLRDLTLY